MLLTGSWFSIKVLIQESTFDFDAGKKKLGNQNLGVLKIWIKETLLLSKTRVVVTENILLLNPHSGYVKTNSFHLQFLFKYKKQATIAALNGEDVFILLSTALKKSWIYQVLMMNFTPIWESEIANQSARQTNLWENWYYCAKIKAL